MSDKKVTRLNVVGPNSKKKRLLGPLHLAVDPSYALDHDTDWGNAARLADRHGGTLRWVEGRGWMTWTGKVWTADQFEAVRCQGETNLFYKAHHEDHDLGSWLRESEERRRITASVELAKAFLPLDIDELDRDPWLLNVRNGTVDLHTGEPREHRAEDLITRIANIDYDPEATCPTFDNFLAQVFDGDEEVISYVQRALGYTLIGDTSEQVLFFATGRGANGKSTLLELVREILGDYALAIPSDTLTRRGEREPYEVADLPGKRLVTAVESEVEKTLAEGLIKAVTGSDTIPARKIRQDPFTFKPQFTLWLATNHLPRIEGTDHAIWRRIRIIDFPRTFTGAEQDKDLPLKLRAEAAGVFRWLVEGAVAYLQHGLAEPTAVVKAVAAYRESQDIVGQWLTDRAELADDAWTSSRDLADSHNQWADANAVDKLSPKALAAKYTERGLQAGKQRGQRGWHGIRLVGKPQPGGGSDPDGDDMREGDAPADPEHDDTAGSGEPGEEGVHNAHVLPVERETPGGDDGHVDAADTYQAILIELASDPDWTYRKLADTVRISRSYLSRIARGRAVPSAHLQDRIVDVLGPLTRSNVREEGSHTTIEPST